MCTVGLAEASVATDSGAAAIQSHILPGDILPGDILPGGILPGDILPSDILPGDILPGDWGKQMMTQMRVMKEGRIIGPGDNLTLPMMTLSKSFTYHPNPLHSL